MDRGIADPHDAFLLDMDHLPAEMFEAILSRLGATGEVRAIAAHGYGQYEDELSGRGLT